MTRRGWDSTRQDYHENIKSGKSYNVQCAWNLEGLKTNEDVKKKFLGGRGEGMRHQRGGRKDIGTTRRYSRYERSPNRVNVYEKISVTRICSTHFSRISNGRKLGKVKVYFREKTTKSQIIWWFHVYCNGWSNDENIFKNCEIYSTFLHNTSARSNFHWAGSEQNLSGIQPNFRRIEQNLSGERM